MSQLSEQDSNGKQDSNGSSVFLSRTALYYPQRGSGAERRRGQKEARRRPEGGQKEAGIIRAEGSGESSFTSRFTSNPQASASGFDAKWSVSRRAEMLSLRMSRRACSQSDAACHPRRHRIAALDWIRWLKDADYSAGAIVSKAGCG
ncbi:hypothetical protein EYF80_008845 [Liparis tanakae]|uniref:Uncharacterized protein n=1 Tax=Liparis tanakae TaxID=230148 RepID=A0A4Z2IS58_9TELE|nr:hypothetical protein EYF80_008845 [Liparis tanakae]